MNSHELVLRHYIKYHLIYNIITYREQQRNLVTEREREKNINPKRENVVACMQTFICLLGFAEEKFSLGLPCRVSMFVRMVKAAESAERIVDLLICCLTR